MAPSISVIIPVYNDKKNITDCIHSVLGQSFPRDRFEIIVVDNNSNDGTAEIIRNFKEIRYHFEGKKGAAASRNSGIAISQGSIIAFTDSDCIVDKNWLTEIDNSIITCDALAGYSDGINKNWIAEVEAEEYEHLMDMIRNNSSMIRMDTRNCAVKKSLLQSLDGFDEKIACSIEDWELSARALAAGYCIRFNQKMIVHHVNGTLFLRQINKEKRRYWDGDRLLQKHNEAFIRQYFPGLLKVSLLHKTMRRLHEHPLSRPFIKCFFWFLVTMLCFLLLLSQKNHRLRVLFFEAARKAAIFS
jgi:glycosyltransferase involved in cell wall biosynthesis